MFSSQAFIFLATGQIMVNLQGQLYGSSSGYLLLQVPNSLAIGAFKALPELGVVLPTFEDRQFSAHITIARPGEISDIGGMDKITERGKTFNYTIDGIDTAVSSAISGEHSRYWFFKVRSAALSELRRTYGLGEPHMPFHITFAARPRLVLRQNGVSKLSGVVFDSGLASNGEAVENCLPFDLDYVERVMSRCS
jgi:hypothetical protein